MFVVSGAVAAPIAARIGGLAEALSILGLVAGYDAAAYVVGSGADNDWEGPAAGVATVLAGALAVAALAEPPFSLVSVGVLALIICVAGPVGPAVARWLVRGDRAQEDPDYDEAGAPEEAPAVRRLSTLFAAGPALLGLLAIIRF